MQANEPGAATAIRSKTGASLGLDIALQEFFFFLTPGQAIQSNKSFHLTCRDIRMWKAERFA